MFEEPEDRADQYSTVRQIKSWLIQFMANTDNFVANKKRISNRAFYLLILRFLPDIPEY